MHCRFVMCVASVAFAVGCSSATSHDALPPPSAVHSAVAPPATSVMADSVSPATRASGFVRLLADRRFTDATAYFDSTMSAALSADKLAEVWQTLITANGEFAGTSNPRVEEREGRTAVLLHTAFAHGALDAVVVFDRSGAIAGLFFRPPAAPRAQATPPAAIQEEAVVVDNGGVALGATVTRPAHSGVFPGVLLLQGSGPVDRDGTTGGNKPLRDLAWGLAERGIVTLRFDKRTLGESRAVRTIDDEVLSDARVALGLLASRPEVDRSRVVIAGHSLGGMVLPRLLQSEHRVAGGILLNANCRPLEDVLLDQVTYLANVDGTVDSAEAAGIRLFADFATSVRSGTVRADEIYFGAPGSYWRDLHAYSAGAAATRLAVPLLLVSGDRDYQVPAADWSCWSDALARRPAVTWKRYSGVNHLLVRGEGAASPAEYQVLSSVYGQVIADLAAWITAIPRATHPSVSQAVTPSVAHAAIQ